MRASEAEQHCISITGSNQADRPCRTGFVWQAGTMTGLEPLPGHQESQAHDVNDSGQIVGLSAMNAPAGGVYDWFGARWDGATVSFLPELRPGDPQSHGITVANAIAVNGRVAGQAGIYDAGLGFPTSRAVTWAPSSFTITEQTPAADLFDISKATGINVDGEIVGVGFRLFSNNLAIASSLTSSSLVLLDETSSASHQRWAYGRNNADLVVGFSNFGSGDERAALWRARTDNTGWETPVPIDPTDRFVWSVAREVNDKGEVVGSALNATSKETAFYYDTRSGELHDLNDLVSDPPAGVVIVDAMDISDAGDIAGSARVGTEAHAVLLKRIR